MSDDARLLALLRARSVPEMLELRREEGVRRSRDPERREALQRRLAALRNDYAGQWDLDPAHRFWVERLRREHPRLYRLERAWFDNLESTAKELWNEDTYGTIRRFAAWIAILLALAFGAAAFALRLSKRL